MMNEILSPHLSHSYAFSSLFSSLKSYSTSTLIQTLNLYGHAEYTNSTHLYKLLIYSCNSE